MIKVIIKDNIIEHCKTQIQKFNFGNRGVADGTKAQQLTGIIGESVVANLFGLPLIDGSGGFDYGEDLKYNNLVIDVKTMGRTTDVRPYYVNNFIGLQKKYKTDIYIFTSINQKTNELTVCGWIDKKLLFDKASFFPKGTFRFRSDKSKFKTFTDLYEISNKDLFQISSIDDLKKQLNKY